MSATGIIFSNIHDRPLSPLTEKRTVGSVPFLCRYRLIDFPLSAMVNANISKIGIITHRSYQSLMDHIGSGKDFDLDRRSGGVRFLPPHITDFSGTGGMYRTRLEALIGILPFITGIKEEFVVMSDCNTVTNMDMRSLILHHKNSDADITVAVGSSSVSITDATYYRIRDGRVCDIIEGISGKDSHPGLNTMVISTDLLRHLISDAAAHGYTDFVGDILRRNITSLKICTIHLTGPAFTISSTASYFAANMALVSDKYARDAIFSLSDRPVYTHSKSSPPTSYTADASVSSSLIADGCRIKGRVENSVIFRGVRIGEGAVVKNSVIMQDTVIGEGACLDHVICDKNVVIRDSRTLSGCEGTPFFISKGHMV